MTTTKTKPAPAARRDLFAEISEGMAVRHAARDSPSTFPNMA